MAIALEFIDIVIQIPAIHAKYPGAWAQCLEDHALWGGVSTLAPQTAHRRETVVLSVTRYKASRAREGGQAGPRA